MEGDWRDTTTLGFAPCHCEQKEHLRDAGDTQYHENARTQQVEDRNRIVRESLADNCKTAVIKSSVDGLYTVLYCNVLYSTVLYCTVY